MFDRRGRDPRADHADHRLADRRVDGAGRRQATRACSPRRGASPIRTIWPGCRRSRCPAASTATGLPIGLQIAGRPFDEATVLRVAHAYERTHEWKDRAPDAVSADRANGETDDQDPSGKRASRRLHPDGAAHRRQEAQCRAHARADRRRCGRGRAARRCCRSCAIPATCSRRARRRSRWPRRCPTGRPPRRGRRRRDATALIIVAGITEREGDGAVQQRRGRRSDAALSAATGRITCGARRTCSSSPATWACRCSTPRSAASSCAICYDIWFPETFRLAALQGADILCVPTNWVPMPEQPGDTAGDGQHPGHGRRAFQLDVRGGGRPRRRRARPAVPRATA